MAEAAAPLTACVRPAPAAPARREARRSKRWRAKDHPHVQSRRSRCAPRRPPSKRHQEPWQALLDSIQTSRARFSGGLRKAVIWSVFFALLHIMRRFFALIFLTFILSFVSRGVCCTVGRALPTLGRRTVLCLWYGLMIALVVVFVVFVIPRIDAEGRQFVDKVPSLYDTAVERIEQARQSNEAFARLYAFIVGEGDVRDLHRGYVHQMADAMTFVLATAIRTVWVLFLSLLFSFLILWDVAPLEEELRSLQETRLAAFYNETKETVVTFARVLGYAILRPEDRIVTETGRLAERGGLARRHQGTRAPAAP